MVTNEMISYDIMADWLHEGSQTQISERSEVIRTYALCGVANVGSIGIQLGGIGGMAPNRRTDLAQLGLRAMLGGTLACFMTACIAGALL